MSAFLSSRLIIRSIPGFAWSGAVANASFISLLALSKSPFASHARQFAMRIPFVRMLLHVDFENGKAFVLLFLLLQTAAIKMKLQPASDVQRLRLQGRSFLRLPLRLQNHRLAQQILKAFLHLNRAVFPLHG